jgi:multiple sugar transport system ATP-binding protein
VGTPREVYERPATSFVGAFLGTPRMNLVAARVSDGAIVAGPFRWARDGGGLPERVDVGVRPEHVRLGESGERGEIVAVEPLGAESHVLVRVGSLELRAQSPGFESRRPGAAVGVSIEAQRVVVFEAEREGRRLD